MLSECGNPPLYSCFVAPTFGNSLVRVEAFIMDDAAGALDAEVVCPSGEQPRKFTYYTATAETFPSTNTTLCTVDEDGKGEQSLYGGCNSALRVSMASSLVTTQKSHHGTTTLEILIDEGSILGAVLFVTWFFGIFVI